MKKNLDMKVNHLNYQQKEKIERLIEKYKTVLAKDKYDIINTVKEYKAHIDLLVEKYCSKKPYRCTIEDKKARLLEENLLEESYSLFAVPVKLAFKKEFKKDANKIAEPQVLFDRVLDEKNEKLQIFLNGGYKLSLLVDSTKD